MAPPTAIETITAPVAKLSIKGGDAASDLDKTKAEASRNASDLVEKYVFYHDGDHAPFDIPEAHVNISGPSPYADLPNEGSSVLESFKPIQKTGALDKKYKYVEVTPLLGREYRNAKVTDILKDDDLLQDLAVTIAERGVVFFRNQRNISVEEQKRLSLALGAKAGNPKSSKLHIHPTALAGGLLKDDGKIDPEVTLLNSRLRNKLYSKQRGVKWSKGSDTVFHSDITFEPVPAGFSMLRIIETPSGDGSDEDWSSGGGPVGGAGGDTLWANGYALAEKISPSFLSYLETLRGEFYQPIFKDATSELHVPLYTAERGAPENVGDEQIAVHPLIRTNPTTGWKSVFAIGSHFHRVIGVTQEESDLIKKYLNDLLYQSPEVQLRFKWNSNDLAIWDNRSTYHSAITDLGALNGNVEVRTGLRTLSTAERPFFSPNSKTQTQALRERLA